MPPAERAATPHRAEDHSGSAPSEKTALVLIAHGSRRPEANDDLRRIAERLRSSGRTGVIATFLELAEPDIVSGGEAMVADGATTVVLAPYFLSAGRHVATDLEEARAELARRHPDRRFLLAGPLGPDPALEALLLRRVDEALENAERIA